MHFLKNIYFSPQVLTLGGNHHHTYFNCNASTNNTCYDEVIAVGKLFFLKTARKNLILVHFPRITSKFQNFGYNFLRFRAFRYFTNFTTIPILILQQLFSVVLLSPMIHFLMVTSWVIKIIIIINSLVFPIMQLYL